jgi:hypothetical protein
MRRLLLLIGAIFLVADCTFAQAQDLDPGQCEQIRQAVAQYGYAAARKHAMTNYGPEAVRRGDKCLTKRRTTRR